MKQRSTHFLRLLMCCLMLAGTFTTARAQNPVQITNFPGIYNAKVTLASGDTLYAAGDKSMAVATQFKGGTKVDPVTGKPDLTFSTANNAVEIAIADGSGGWYIGGLFTQVGGQARNGLARINADGSLNAWNPDAGTDAEIQSLALYNGQVYVGGVFSSLGGQAVSSLGSVDAVTGATDPAFNFHMTNVSDQLAGPQMLLVKDDILYAGGGMQYRPVDTQPAYKYLIAFNLTTKTLITKDYGVTGDYIYSMALSGNTLYVCGYFDSILGIPRTNLAGIDLNSGILTSFNPVLNNRVQSVDIYDNTIYCSGFFNEAKGETRNNMAAFKLSDGSLTSFNPNPNARVNQVKIVNGILYCLGETALNQVMGIDRPSHTFAIDLATNQLTDWQVPADGAADLQKAKPLITLAESNGALYAGGYFSYFTSGTPGTCIAAIKISTGEILTDFKPGVLDIGEYTALAVYGNVLYAGGDGFTNVGGLPRSSLAAYNRKTGELINFNPFVADDHAIIIAMTIKNDILYTGGTFPSVGGINRKNLASFNLANGNLTTWNPAPNNPVRTIAVNNNKLYAAGDFTTIASVTRNRLAAFDLLTGNITAWDPNITGGQGFASALSFYKDLVFVGGDFDHIGDLNRNYIAAIDANTGVATDFDGNADYQVLALAVKNDILYTGGTYSVIGNSPRSLASFDLAASGLAIPTDWAPDQQYTYYNFSQSGSKLFLTQDIYTTALLAFQLPIIVQPQTITFADFTKTYGDTDAAAGATSTNSTIPITYALTNQKDVNGNTATIGQINTEGNLQVLMPGTATITASQAANAEYTAALDVSVTLTIGKKVLNVKAADATKVYAAANPAFTTTYVGLVAETDAEKAKISGTATVTVTDPANGGADPGVNAPVGTYSLVPDISPLTSNYYTFTPVNGSLTVTTNPQTIAISGIPATTTYGDAPAAISVTSNSTADITTSTSDANVATVTKDATGQYLLNPIGAGTATIIFNQAADANYDAGTATQSITIAKKPLTSVVVNDQTILTGQPMPAFTATVTSFVNGDATETAITPALAFGSVSNTNTAGVYDINISNYSSLTSANYTLPADYTKGKLTIGSLSLNDIAKIYGDTPFNPGATSSNGGTPTYTFSNPDVASYDAATGLATIKRAGTVNITATISGSSITRSLTVAKKEVTVAAANTSRTYGLANPAIAITYTGFIAGEDESNVGGFSPAIASVTATPATDAGTYPVTFSGAAATNYTFTYTTGATLTVNKAPLTIAANNQTKVYGQPNPALSISYTGFVNGDDAGKLSAPATASNTATAASGVGSYPISLTTATATNYQITQVNGTLNITPAALTITADNFTRDRGNANPAFTVRYNGFMNVDNAASLTVAATATTSATPTSPAGAYPIIPAGAVGANYTYTYVNGTLTVNGNQLLTFSPFSVMTYGDADFNPGASSDQGGTPIYTTSNPAVAQIVAGKVHISGAGTAEITATFPAAGGYNISTAKQTLTVLKKNLNIQADDKSRAFGEANPVFTFTYNGFVNGDVQTTPGALNSPVTASTTATTTSPVGNYPINPGAATSNNYNITFLPGTLNVNSLTRVLTFNALATKTYGNGDFDAASLNTGEQPLYTFSDPAVASIVGGKIHINGAGTTTITVTAPVNSNYNSVTPVSQTLTVNKAPLIITVNNKTKTQGPPDILLTAAYNGFVNGDTQLNLTTQAVLSTTAKINSPLGTYAITASGAASPNYDIIYQNGTLSIILGAGQEEVLVSQALSPDGDGVNDYFQIGGIENFQSNHVTIINRNGIQVWEASGYDNSSRKFDGRTTSGNQLQQGTYYFLISYNVNGQQKKKTGYLILKY